MKINKDNIKIGLSKEAINIIVADLLNGNSNNYSDKEIENIIKIFCLSRIDKYYNDFNVMIMDTNALNELFSLENINGLVKGNTIFLKRENVLEIRKGKVDIIRTIMHEVEHVIQNYKLEHNDISYRTYLTLMDEIVSYKIGNNFYNNNYYYIFTELDARIHAEFGLYDYLYKYCPNLLDNELENIVDNIAQCEKDSFINYRIIDGERYDLEELFDTIILNDLSLVKECPILNFYYNLDGSKIPLGDLIQRKSALTDNIDDLELINKIKKLDSFIIKNRRGSIENIKRDIDSIKELNNDDYNDIIIELTNRINDYNTCDISYLYDVLQINSFKNRLSKTKIAAEKYAMKVYKLFNK